MKNEIRQFCLKVCKRHPGLEAIYMPVNDVYSIRFRGRGVHNFDSKRFYELPKRYREVLVGRLLRVGLHHNSGEKSLNKRQLYLDRSLGKKII